VTTANSEAVLAVNSALDFSDLKKVLDRITSRLVESSDPGALFEAVVQIAMDTTEAQASSLYLEQSDEQQSAGPRIVMVAGAGYELHRVGKASYAKGEGLTGSIWEKSQSRKYDRTEDLEATAGPWRGVHNDLIRKIVPNWVCSSLIGVPLRIGARTIGVIKVENKNPGPPACFTDRDLLVLELIASTMALAIEDRRLSEKAYRSILNALSEVSETLVSKDIMPFSALCDRIVRKCIEVFNAQACSLYLESPSLDPANPPQTITMVAGAGYEVHRVGQANYTKGQGLTGSIWQESKSVKYDSTADLEKSGGPWRGVHNQTIKDKVPNWVCSSLIGVPLRIGQRTIGVIKVENKNPAPQAHFSYEELRSLEILASNIALALDMLNWHREVFWQGERARAFAHNLAGQVRNALLNVQMSASELRQFPERDRTSDILDRLGIAERILTDYEQFRRLTFSKTPAGRHHAPIDVKLLVLDLLRRSDKILGEKGIKPETSFPAGPIYVNVDRDQVLQALGNILSNAIEALATQADPRISISVQERPSSKNVAISIADNGGGLSHEHLEKLRQAGRILSTKHPGIGAGLPEASRCCDDNGGYLELPDGNGDAAGCAFRVVLPTCNPQMLRLAIIDDDSGIFDSFRLELRKRNDVQATFFSSPDCLQPGTPDGAAMRTRMDDFDFILLDCQFDGIGVEGVQLYRELSKAGSPLAPKILLMSGVEEFFGRPGPYVYDKFEEILARFDEFVAMLHSREVPA